MKKIILVFSCLVLLLFASCDPASGISVTNKTDFGIYLEYELNDFELNEHLTVNNNIYINANDDETLFSAFPHASIIGALGFGPVKTDDDIIRAIDQIFKSIGVYQVTGDGRNMLYDKTYFLNKNNMKVSRFPVNYWIQFIIK